MAISERLFTISQGDYSLRRNGYRDAARHDDKIKENLKGNLDQIISDDDIIIADPKSKVRVRVPLRGLILPRIIHGEDKDGVGSGEGEIGDIISREPGDGQGQGAGQAPGQETYEMEISVEELQDLIFAGLGLPFLERKKLQQLETDAIVFDEIRPRRTPTNLDAIRTVVENMKRNALETGRAKIGGIRPEDLRNRTFRNEVKEDNAAAVILMRDFSGSMGTEETNIVRWMGAWTVAFLRSRYPKVETAFIVHDTRAVEVNKEDFLRRRDGGGTTCSSAYEMALSLMKTRYFPDSYNVYGLHFSDGDNWGDDNRKCVQLVQEILDFGAAQIGFFQVGRNIESGLLSVLTKGIKSPRFTSAIIEDKSKIKDALGNYFDPKRSLVPV